MNVVRAKHAGACYGVQRALDMAYAAILDGETRTRSVRSSTTRRWCPSWRRAACGWRSAWRTWTQAARRRPQPRRDARSAPGARRARPGGHRRHLPARRPRAEGGGRPGAALRTGAWSWGRRAIPRSKGSWPARARRAGEVLVATAPEHVPDGLVAPVGVVVQTTQTREVLDAVVWALEARGIEPEVKNTICFATRQRQEAAAELGGPGGRHRGRRGAQLVQHDAPGRHLRRLLRAHPPRGSARRAGPRVVRGLRDRGRDRRRLHPRRTHPSRRRDAGAAVAVMTDPSGERDRRKAALASLAGIGGERFSCLSDEELCEIRMREHASSGIYPSKDIEAAADSMSASGGKAAALGALVVDVEPGSPADDAGFEPGCRVTHVDGQSRARRHRLALAFSRRRRVHRLRRSRRRRGRGGACARRRARTGASPSKAWCSTACKQCRNACLFCFMRQLPEGMRPSLTLRDDDFRLSFLSRHLRHAHEPGVRGRGAHRRTAHLAPARVAARVRRPTSAAGSWAGTPRTGWTRSTACWPPASRSTRR